MKILIDIPEESIRYANEVPNTYCKWLLSYNDIIRAIKLGTPIPDNATNGDMIEKFFGKDIYCTLIRMMYSSCCEKMKKWWNAPYRKE